MLGELGLLSSASTTIVRSLNIAEGLPSRPTRSWGKTRGQAIHRFTAMAANSISGDVTTNAVTAMAMSKTRLATARHPPRLDRLDVDEGPPTEVLGPKAGDVDVAEPGGQGHVVAGIRQLTGELVDDVRRDGRQRDHHAGGTGRFEHGLGRLVPPSTLTPRTPTSSGPTKPTTR